MPFVKERNIAYANEHAITITFSISTFSALFFFSQNRWIRGVLVVGPRCRRVPASKPDSSEDPPCMLPVARKIIRGGQMSSCWCDAED
ncbi:hypothetical protein AVEN_17902-1 [Araneus ventricosus]|uniref:Uncharacterized protein n=1 Tax=Araneus ventricosus TaxID=182803 RepID=A0A4Y2Q5G9_ARAVE|nr:hypothetical protein AVEN_17902-1 [Araneus ventricosus]